MPQMAILALYFAYFSEIVIVIQYPRLLGMLAPNYPLIHLASLEPYEKIRFHDE